MATISLFCLATSRSQADSIVARLQATGIPEDDISVLVPPPKIAHDFAPTKATKSPESTVTGAGTGGVVGGTLGLLAGIGAITIPGAGPLIAAGPIMAAFSGAFVGAAVGGLAGALIGLGVPEYEAKRYEGKIRRGNILISVHAQTSGQIRRVKEAFRDSGIADIASSADGKTLEPVRTGRQAGTNARESM